MPGSVCGGRAGFRRTPVCLVWTAGRVLVPLTKRGSRVRGGVRNVSVALEQRWSVGMRGSGEAFSSGEKKGLGNLTGRMISKDREVAEATQDEYME